MHVPTSPRPFPVIIDVNENADLTTVVKEVLRERNETLHDWIENPAKFTAVCMYALSLNQRQCLIRRFRLYRAGPQELMPWAEIARERNGSSPAARQAVSSALRALREEAIEGSYMRYCR